MASNEDIRAMFDGKYLGSWDLQGRDVVVKIAKVLPGELPKQGTSAVEKKPLIFFEGKEKGMVLNKTNMHAIAGIYGTYKAKDWIGKYITIYATTCQFGRNTVDCLRVRPTAPRGRGTPAPAPSEREPGDDDAAAPSEAA